MSSSKNEGSREPPSVRVSVSVTVEKMNNSTTPVETELKVYGTRWVVLGVYAFYAALSTFQWIQFSIINNIVCRYYGVTSTAVDWMANTFMLYYIPLIFPASNFMDRIGLRWTAILGSALSCLGSWIKVFSVTPDRFYLTFIGQSAVASIMVMVYATPGALAAQWFGSDQQSTATSLGIFGTQLGVAMGFLITPMVVRNHEQLDDIAVDLSHLSLGVAFSTTIAAVAVILFFKGEPLLPPSETRALQKAKRSESKEEGFIQPMKRLFTNKSYLILCNSYGVNVGVISAVSTLLNQMFLLHFENGEEDAGRIGLIVILLGMPGAVIFGMILDKTHKFKETTVTVYFLCLCGQVLFAIALWLEVKWMVYVAAAFLGFFMSGYMTLGYEMCAEYTYPEAESIATGLLNIFSSTYCIILVVLFGKLMNIYGDVPIHVGFCTVLLAGFVMTVLTKDERRRHDAGKAATDARLPATKL